MKCKEIIKRLEQMAPINLACEWDNPGLLAGRSDKEVKSIMIALDATDSVIEEAIKHKVDLLLTHHPLIFKPIKKINDQDFITKRLLTLIQHDISYYVAHTNFDIAPGGMADLAARRLDLTDLSVLEPIIVNDHQQYGIGKVGMLSTPLTLAELGQMVKRQFQLPYVTIYGIEQLKAPISHIAISPGSGSSVITAALLAEVEVLITGDIGHHVGIDAVSQGLAIIDAGHYGLEHIFVDFMEQYINHKIDPKINVVKETPMFPAVVLT